ncbi:cytochrome-c oxidase, cbb3-type subunit III [Mesorhizobium sp. M4B.F.Ca.ET.215.01.1.1]|uniref:cytochrome-c oxidase, cbb3-type subunit III n=1 Tax=Mesorhizobium TaxID=68287 RepID=UPI000FCC99CB|nr:MULTISPECIES: cytochrome-c oxidase, cbb3-type subunit III [Mesorhizobium]RVC64936.1 cytochrome-c oxidase, cbb3-type subunit III [Mesorhizobium sp. M4B.F.Ca.ET.088.02.2.1]MDX8434740.1 cytochrome-c oxidase, cbb3-type subunit III [Mesorhizobium abyssinicae]RUW27780.1 cytochrome-c oxidase, cbb3-type subunit III [Mesorhizobium sp. M4B.F.Ca.ET.013.02.1.1]RUW78736.1 cytochrome-c oxidase, cbb3-type subunit III [Mesorhizobium sp. M4B.F.Ca.ET.049.02.1.2]RVD46661.1 cytochrome-c oxidase, cbb3-type subu
MSSEHIDDVSGISTTGHEWDGIKELNNPLPRWWVITFYVTIIWAVGYTIAYPAWPMLSSATKGVLGYSSRNDVRNELAAAEAAKGKYVAAIQEKTVSQIAADDALREFAVAAGGATFKVNCVQCHGSGAQGSKGFPNLNDDDWLWGGMATQVEQTIMHGIRFASDPDTRQSEMPAFGAIITGDQIKQVSAYVAGLSGPVQNKGLIEPGAKVFAENCVACHGANAKGNREFGAPDLTDAIWLYGSGETAIAAQVREPKHGVMPAWIGRLGETKVKELAVYVHSLGGGK